MRRATPLLMIVLLAMLAGTPAAHAADKAMRQSLQQFFARGIVHDGAVAELAGVTRWPQTTGRMRWRLPHIAHYPTRLSLIAEQGTGSKLRRWYVPVRVHWWAKALVASHEIPARSHVQASMLKLARIDMAGITGTFWSDPAALVGTRTTRPLHTGQPLLSTYITRPALLRTGDQVTLVTHIGGVRVTATGKVLRNAGAGDRVRIQNLRSKEVVEATILDAHTARIVSGGAS